jgi:predicted RNA-binding Zn-ribbon protein involved in translation (DUF1610 family)
MTVSDEIKTITVGAELSVCPNCGYDKGFHVSFQNMIQSDSSPVKTTRDMLKIILICPNCGARYDIGWKIPSGK